MPIDTHNLIQQKQVAPDVFACLYQGLKIYFLRLTHTDGLEYGGDEEVSFVLVPTESYSLQFHGQEVWSQSEVPNWANPGLPLGPLEPEKDEARRKYIYQNLASVKPVKNNFPRSGVFSSYGYGGPSGN